MDKLYPLLLSLWLLACQPKEAMLTHAPPLIDGSINEYSKLGIEPISLSDEVNLYLYQNEHYVWFAYNYPEGSYGTLDLKLVAPALTDTINLHVSGQIGEWYTKKDAPRPDNPESELWWNHQGWYANEVWINGMDTSKTKPTYRFKNAKGREIQLSKERFGRDKWHLHFQIRAIRTPEGTFTKIEFPNDGSFYSVIID